MPTLAALSTSTMSRKMDGLSMVSAIWTLSFGTSSWTKANFQMWRRRWSRQSVLGVRSSALGEVCAESYCNFPASAVDISNKKLFIKYPAHHKKKEARRFQEPNIVIRLDTVYYPQICPGRTPFKIEVTSLGPVWFHWRYQFLNWGGRSFWRILV